MSQNARRSDTDTAPDTFDADAVVAWLRMHPGFLAEHPDVLRTQRLEDPQQGGDAASLLQRQNQLLRTQIEDQQARLETLTQAARANERLLNRWHALTLDLVAGVDLVEGLDLLDDRLRRDFDADHVVLRLADHALDDSDLLQARMVRRSQPDHQVAINQLLSQRSAYCGRLTANKRVAVFGEDRPASVTLVAVEDLAVLAIGSDDPDRFVPGMGGLFIELLGKTVAWQLHRHVDALRKQA
jgi:uncharacterized protein YigA (DUF484 family)